MDDELRTRLVEESHWRWVPGMVDTAGRRVVAPEDVPGDAIPDLDDWATVGALLGLIAAHDALSDVVRDGPDWVVAVHIDGDLSGYAAETLGEAAAWALLAVWENLPGGVGDA